MTWIPGYVELGFVHFTVPSWLAILATFSAITWWLHRSLESWWLPLVWGYVHGMRAQMEREVEADGGVPFWDGPCKAQPNGWFHWRWNGGGTEKVKCPEFCWDTYLGVVLKPMYIMFSHDKCFWKKFYLQSGSLRVRGERFGESHSLT